MRWLSFFMLAYVAVGLQTGIAAAIQWHGAGPNLVLIAAVFIAMNAPRDVGLLGAFILGALQDLTSGSALGLYAFSYGLVALFVASARQVVYREHPLTHFSLTLMGGFVTGTVLAIHGWWRRHDASPLLAESPLLLFYTAVYSAVLAPFVLGILQRMTRAFKFESSRRRKMISARGR
jgi:rod shape-determining protein MreD